MTKLREQVTEFHRAFGVPVHNTPRIPDKRRIQLRLRLIAEEFCELLAACGGAVSSLSIDKLLAQSIEELNAGEPDLVEIADGLADLRVVICGTELEFGIDGEDVLAEVMASNLSKIGSSIREDGKVMKDAPGFFRPDIAARLKKQGRDG